MLYIFFESDVKIEIEIENVIIVLCEIIEKCEC